MERFLLWIFLTSIACVNAQVPAQKAAVTAPTAAKSDSDPCLKILRTSNKRVPTYFSPYEEPVSFVKIQKDITLRLSIKVEGILEEGKNDVTILFDDGKKWTLKNSIRVDVNGYSYRYHTSIVLNSEQIKKLKKAKIISYRLFKFDQDNLDGELYRKYFNCIADKE